MRPAAALLPLLLAACAPLRPAPEIRVLREPVEVQVPVAVPCVAPEAVPARPPLATDAELAQLPDGALVLALEQQRRALRAHQQQVDALLAACARPVSLPPSPKEPK